MKIPVFFLAACALFLAASIPASAVGVDEKDFQLEDELDGAALTPAMTTTHPKLYGGSKTTVKKFGPITVVETRSEMVIDASTVLVDSIEKKGLAEGLLKAAFPENMGVPGENGLGRARGIGLEYPSVYTIDEFIELLKRGDRANGGYGFDEAAERARFKEELGGQFAVVRRYISTKK